MALAVPGHPNSSAQHSGRQLCHTPPQTPLRALKARPQQFLTPVYERGEAFFAVKKRN